MIMSRLTLALESDGLSPLNLKNFGISDPTTKHAQLINSAGGVAKLKEDSNNCERLPTPWKVLATALCAFVQPCCAEA